MLGRVPDLSTHTMEDYTAINNDRHTYLSMWEDVHALPVSLGLVIYTLMVSCTHPSSHSSQFNYICNSLMMAQFGFLRKPAWDKDLEAGHLSGRWSKGTEVREWGQWDRRRKNQQRMLVEQLSLWATAQLCWEPSKDPASTPIFFPSPHSAAERTQRKTGYRETGGKATRCWWTWDWDKHLETKQVAKETLQWDREK